MMEIDISEHPLWKEALSLFLMRGDEVTLLNFSREKHSEVCLAFAIEYRMDFLVHVNGVEATFLQKTK